MSDATLDLNAGSSFCEGQREGLGPRGAFLPRNTGENSAP